MDKNTIDGDGGEAEVGFTVAREGVDEEAGQGIGEGPTAGGEGAFISIALEGTDDSGTTRDLAW